MACVFTSILGTLADEATTMMTEIVEGVGPMMEIVEAGPMMEKTEVGMMEEEDVEMMMAPDIPVFV